MMRTSKSLPCTATFSLGSLNLSTRNECGRSTHRNVKKHRLRIVGLPSKIWKILGIAGILESVPSSRKIALRCASRQDGVSVRNSNNSRLHESTPSGGQINVTTENYTISMRIVPMLYKRLVGLRQSLITRCSKELDSGRGRDCSGNVNLDSRRV